MEQENPIMNMLTPQELHGWLADARRPAPFLLDVREPWEFAIGHIAGAINIPLASIPARQQEVPDDQPVVCICHHGMRSAQVAMFLAQQGFEPLYNLSGGVAAWSRTVDASLPAY